ncbi:GPI inositol deacylase, partial [Kappamyces sp. JEL0680]
YELLMHHEMGVVEKGIPVLFLPGSFWRSHLRYAVNADPLPGNAGNFKQIRSLGAVQARVWNWEFKDRLRLELYAVSTREEMSAFNSLAIQDQAFYANEAIQWILSSYDKDKAPRSIFVVGHSMGQAGSGANSVGGVVARYLPLLDNYRPGSIENIFTLATPHKEPPVTIYRSLQTIYDDIHSYWIKEHGKGGQLDNVVLVSVAGGTRDITLHSTLTYLQSSSSATNTLDLFSSGIVDVWSSADHEGAVWCDQTLQALSRAIFRIQALGDHEQTVALR